MAGTGKRYQSSAVKRDDRVFYKLDEALELIKQTGSAKFDETVDAAINLGVNAKKSDQNVRGATVLPRGTGRTMRVAVFAEGADADAAREAGADLVGLEDLAEQVQGGDIEFSYFGLLPNAIGKGLGGHMLADGLERAFDLGALRPWLHTCSLDHPNALSSYQAGGMELYKSEQDIQLIPKSWPMPSSLSRGL